MTIVEVAELARCHRKTVERAIKAGRLEAVNIGEPGARRPELRITPEAYRSWLEQGRVAPTTRSQAKRAQIMSAGVRGRGTLQVAEGMGR